MRRLLKFLHTIGAIGLMGSMASLLALVMFASPSASLSEYASVRSAMSAIATWVFFPSLGVTLISGLVAIAYSPAYHSAGWAWAKALSGILLFESGFVGILGPMQEEAKRTATALAAGSNASFLTPSLTAERNTLLILLAVAAFNVAFGIWRPRLTRQPD